MMHIQYDAGGEIAAENGKIHYRGEKKTGLLIVDEGISYLDLLSLVKRACGTEAEGPLLLVRARSEDAGGFRALLHNSPASMASPPPPRATGTRTPLVLKYVPTNFQKEEHLPTNDTTVSTVAGMASMATTTHLQLSEFRASENRMAVPTSSGTPLLLKNSTEISSTSLPLDLQPVVLETTENHQSIPTSSGTPMPLSASDSSRNDNTTDAMKELNEKQAKIQKPKLVDMEWISSLLKSLMEWDLPCEELDIMEQISDHYGYDVDFKVVWKSRNLAIKELGLLEDNEEIVKKLKKKKEEKGEKKEDAYSVEVVKELKEITQASHYIFVTKKPKLVDKEWISNLTKSLMERDLPCEELDIMEQISDHYGYDVDFKVVWKSRNLAIKELGLLFEDNEEIVKKLKKNKEKGEKEPMIVPSIDRKKDDASAEVIKELIEITQASRYIFITRKPKLVDKEWISNFAKSLMEQDDLPCTEKYIVDEINKEFGYDVDFKLAWKSRNLALKQLGLVEDDDKVKFDWEEFKKKKVGRRVPDMYDDDELDDEFDGESDDEFVDESDDEVESFAALDDDQEGGQKKENTKVAQAGQSRKKGGCRTGDVPGMSRMTDMTAMGNIPYMANMQAGVGNMPFMGMNSNLRNGLNVPPQSFHDLNTSEPEKAVSGSSSSDISGLQKGLSEIRAFLEEFRRIIMILLTVILLFLLLHHQTGKR